MFGLDWASMVLFFQRTYIYHHAVESERALDTHHEEREDGVCVSFIYF